jgi:hypothetical protein
MGNCWSGRKEGSELDRRPCVEKAHSVDVRVWRRQGRLVGGSRFGEGVAWFALDTRPIYDQLMSSFLAACEDDYSVEVLVGGEEGDRMPRTVSFLHHWAGASKTDEWQHVSLEWSACHYGGQRPWFLCSGCSTRCAILYAGHIDSEEWRGRPIPGLWCRSCLGLAYDVQREGQIARYASKAHRLRRRLGGWLSGGRLGTPIPPRPPRMRQATYERIVTELAEAEGAWLRAWAAKGHAMRKDCDQMLEASRQRLP